MPTLSSLSIAAVSLVCAALASCSSNSPGTTYVPADTGVTDAGAVMDVPAVDVPDVPTVMRPDSGCPAAEVIPAQPLPGFLAPRTVRLIRSVDGDTAHFTWPIVGDLDVRMLWVNTEESHGAETTAFGTFTAQQVATMLGAAREIILMPRERAGMPGVTDVDTYGRTLALVFVDGELFQTRLVREGWSAYYAQFGCAPEPVHTALLNAEAEARAGMRGVWQPGHPTDYAEVFSRWTPARNACRPNPYRGQPYCQ
ncbi:MAG: thermonuclease family protein [Polyangiales bacterium]